MTEAQKSVGDAIAAYKKEGKDSVSPAFRSIIRGMIETNTKTEFANDSYFDALYLTDVMFGRAEQSVRLLTGPGLDKFLEALEKPFRDLLERLTKTGGFVRVVMLGSTMPANLLALCKEFNKVLTIHRASTKEQLKHFIVCDSRMARLEEPHGDITESSLATEIKARVYFNDPVKAEVFEKYFDTIWETVAQFPVNKEAARSLDAALHAR